MRRTEGYLTRGRFLATLICALLVCGTVGFACLFFGQADMAPTEVLRIVSGREAPGAQRNIMLMQRVPRVLLAILAGGGLAVAGAVFQALLRNPLATPHVLGVSAGGALGAVVALSLQWSAPVLGPITSLQFYALIGALLNVAIVYALARRRESFSPLKLLLAGVTLGIVSSAMIMLVRFVSDPHKLVMVDRWLMGGLDVQGFSSIASILPLYLPALAVLLTQAGALNQLALGEEMAAGRGVDVAAVQVEAFLAGSVLTALIVSVAGPIGFVGLIVPHVLRGIIGPDHRSLLFACFFAGGAFLAAADTVARSAFAPSELPVGVLTAIMGGPFFLLLLVRLARYR
jgi:iron complex transport system permease protein